MNGEYEVIVKLFSLLRGICYVYRDELAHTRESIEDLWLLVTELIEGLVDQTIDIRIGHGACTLLSFFLWSFINTFIPNYSTFYRFNFTIIY